MWSFVKPFKISEQDPKSTDRNQIPRESYLKIAALFGLLRSCMVVVGITRISKKNRAGSLLDEAVTGSEDLEPLEQPNKIVVLLIFVSFVIFKCSVITVMHLGQASIPKKMALLFVPVSICCSMLQFQKILYYIYIFLESQIFFLRLLLWTFQAAGHWSKVFEKLWREVWWLWWVSKRFLAAHSLARWWLFQWRVASQDTRSGNLWLLLYITRLEMG